MMKSIELDKEEMEAIMKALPKELRKKLMASIKPSSGIEIIKEFVEKYEDDDMGDHIIAHTVSSLIHKITSCAYSISKDREKSGDPRISTIEMGHIVIEILKAEAEHVSQAISEHDKDCDNKNCGARH